MSEGPVLETHFPGLQLLSRGKVRDVYDLGDSLLIVATDRISAFDVVMLTPVPDKGRILTRLSEFWLDFVKDVVETHMIATDVGKYPPVCQPFAAQLAGRSMWVRKAQMLPFECIVRGYLAGSGWKDYRRTGSICGIPLPAGLQEAEKLPEPIFTPSTKAERGEHDQNVTFEEMERQIGKELAGQVKAASLKVYKKAAEYARERGIIVADTKFEFGLVDGRLLLVDEVLTPDSSRFWPADRYKIGCSPESFDKQYLRDYLIHSGWTVADSAPSLPPDVVENTRSRYLEALERISGHGIG